MKARLNIRIFFWVSIFLFVTSMIYRNVKTPFNHSFASQNKVLTNLYVKDKKINLGKLKMGDEAKSEFFIYNAGTENLIIDNIKVSCTCSTSSINDNIVLPGDSIPVTIQYNKKAKGYFFSDILIYGNFPSSPEILSFEGFLTNN